MTLTGSTSMPQSFDVDRVTPHMHVGQKIPVPDTDYGADFWRDVDDEGVGGQVGPR